MHCAVELLPPGLLHFLWSPADAVLQPLSREPHLVVEEFVANYWVTKRKREVLHRLVARTLICSSVNCVCVARLLISAMEG